MRHLLAVTLVVAALVAAMWAIRPDLAPSWDAGECLPVGRSLICKPAADSMENS